MCMHSLMMPIFGKHILYVVVSFKMLLILTINFIRHLLVLRKLLTPWSMAACLRVYFDVDSTCLTWLYEIWFRKKSTKRNWGYSDTQWCVNTVIPRTCNWQKLQCHSFRVFWWDSGSVWNESAPITREYVV